MILAPEMDKNLSSFASTNSSMGNGRKSARGPLWTWWIVDLDSSALAGFLESIKSTSLQVRWSPDIFSHTQTWTDGCLAAQIKLGVEVQAKLSPQPL